MVQRREDTFRRYEEAAYSLAEAEHEIHEQMGGSRAEIMAEKRFLLFKEMCRDAHVLDPDLMRHYVGGLNLTGEASVTGEFPERRKAPTLTVEQVMKAAKWTRHAAMGRQTRSEDPEMDAEVWKASKEEIDKKWLRGPFSERELVELLGPLYVVSRRFGIRQKGKVRVIDDLSESLINSCFGTFETVDLGGVDELAVLSRTWLQAISDDRKVCFKLSDGRVISGTLHASLTLACARALAGRTLDLESAYKQLLVRKANLWAAVLKIHNTDTGRDELYVSEVLPFGASAAVFGFNRFSRALRKIGTRLFHLIWTNFLDDFPQVDLVCMGQASMGAAERMLELLGWRFSKKPEKRLPFSRSFDVLGVVVDLSASESGTIVVRNKADRVDAIATQVDDIIAEGVCKPSTAASLRGRFQFAEGQLYGRAVAVCTPNFRRRALGHDNMSLLHEQVIAELRWVVEFLRAAAPRTLRAKDTRKPLLIFTDASLEDNDMKASIGGVMYDGAECEYFSAELSKVQLESLQTESTHVIAVLEVLPVACAMRVWSERALHRRVFYFIDNDAARACLIKMISGSPIINRVLKRITMIGAAHPSFAWYSRVPSDEPSRLLPLLILQEEARYRECEMDDLMR